ncbi:MAG: PIN domain-containing protein [Dactylosporangium sp.]|nr:PIN domain-containing protein [Dactylosporangium sp.]
MIWDTSALLALVDGDDPRHADVTRAVDWQRPLGVLSPLVLTEFDHLLRHKVGHRDTRRAIGAIVDAAFEVAHLSLRDIAACLEIDQQYAGLELGLVDASLILLAERYHTTDVVTLDERHFRAVRPRYGGPAFRILPADA